MNISTPASFARSGTTIAVIEDVKDLATTLVMLLEAEGYVARCASDGAAGIALMREIGADAVLPDYRLPDMTGKQIAQALSAGATERSPRSCCVPALRKN